MDEDVFAVYQLNGVGQRKAREISEKFSDTLLALEKIFEPRNICGREWALVKTKLEEASFFAKKAMAMLPENHETK